MYLVYNISWILTKLYVQDNKEKYVYTMATYYEIYRNQKTSSCGFWNKKMETLKMGDDRPISAYAYPYKHSGIVPTYLAVMYAARLDRNVKN